MCVRLYVRLIIVSVFVCLICVFVVVVAGVALLFLCFLCCDVVLFRFVGFEVLCSAFL